MLITIFCVCIFVSVLIVVVSHIHQKFVVIPRCRKELGEALESEQNAYDEKIDRVVSSVKERFEIETNPIRRKVYESFVENYKFVTLHNLYLSRKLGFESRVDFKRKFVQEYYERNNAQLEDLGSYKKYDIESLIPANLLIAYRKLSDSFNAISNSDMIRNTSSVIELTPDSFFYLSVGEIDVPAFVGDNGEKLIIYPTFAILYKGDDKISFIEFKDLKVKVSADSYTEYSSEDVPSDAIIEGYSWKHMTKSGAPDGRYSFNPRYATYRRGILSINPGNVKLWCSNSMSVINFSIAELSLASENLNVTSPMHFSKSEVKCDVTDTKIKDKNTLREEDNSSNIGSPDIVKTLCDYIEMDPMFIEKARYIITQQIASTSSIQRKYSIGYRKAGMFMDMMESVGFIGPSMGGKPRSVLILIDEFESLLKQLDDCKYYRAEKYNSSPAEDLHEDVGELDTENEANQTIVGRSAVEELNSLIGIDSVKSEVEQLMNFIKIQQIRASKGMKVSPISYHCVFTGNPGTGKTTVARIIAKIYKELGILSKGHLIETDRSGLVAEYVGQTAMKTNKIIDSALDGVLFIDEAYSLVSENSSDFGNEAISTLLKRMEDDRNRLVVILAGYGDEMKDFINANPGLESRFNRYINFDDYSSEELLEIFKLSSKNNDYFVTDEALSAVKSVIDKAMEIKTANFGNARFVRNLFEKTLQLQATRLSKMSDISVEQLQQIVKEDIPSD